MKQSNVLFVLVVLILTTTLYSQTTTTYSRSTTSRVGDLYNYNHSDADNLLFGMTSFYSSSAKTKFEVAKKDKTAFGSTVTIDLRLDSPNGDIVKSVKAYSGDKDAKSSYYYFDDDLKSKDNRDYYATLDVGGFTHIAGPITIIKTVTTNRLSTPVVTSPNNNQTNASWPVVISWDAVSGATNYRIQVSEIDNLDTENGFLVYVLNTTTANTSYTWTEAKPGKKYYVTVRAGSLSTMNSLYSPTIGFVTRLQTVNLLLPADGTGELEGVVTLTWEEVPYATAYRVHISKSPSFDEEKGLEDNAISVQVTTNSYDFDDADPGATYYWTVRAGSQSVYQGKFTEPIQFTMAKEYEQVSGTVWDVQSNKLVGVTLKASGYVDMITDIDGSFVYKVATGSSITITPSKAGYTFEPTSRSYIVTDDITHVDFVATYTSVNDSCNVSGYVFDNQGNPIEGAVVDISGNGNTTTNSSGFYSKVVPYGYSGKVSALKDGYLVSPEYISLVQIKSDINNQNFIGTQVITDLGYKLPFPAGMTFNVSYGFLTPPTHVKGTYYDDRYSVDFTMPGDADAGMPVLAIFKGKVVFADYVSGYGYRVVVDHENGYLSDYSHLTCLSVKTGDFVLQGQEIAVIWDSGNADGYHLHFGLKIRKQDGTLESVRPILSGYLDFPSWSFGYKSDNQYYVDGRIVEEYSAYNSSSFESTVITKGHGGSYGYKSATFLAPTMIMMWRPNFVIETIAEVLVYPDVRNDATTKAKYIIRHKGGEKTVVINQLSFSQPRLNWISLGVYTFSPGQDQYVLLSNQVGNINFFSSEKVLFDAIYFHNHSDNGGLTALPENLNIYDVQFPDTIYEGEMMKLNYKIESLSNSSSTIVRTDFVFRDSLSAVDSVKLISFADNINIGQMNYYSCVSDIRVPSKKGNYVLEMLVTSSSGRIFNWVSPINIIKKDLTSVEDETIPDQYYLGQNYPNPFNPETTISYKLPENKNVKIEVFDMLGQVVQVLVDTYKSAGEYTIKFNASNFSNGMYLYRLVSGNTVITKKMILLK